MNSFNQVIPFLSELAANNNKAWFDAHRPWYQEARAEMTGIVAGLIHGLAAIDPSIGSPDPKKCQFRINRDIRFSPNKDPYKTNMGAYFAPGGKNLPAAGYYLHLEPGASFVGGGLYHPEKEQLQKVRQEIYFNAQDFLQIVNDEKFRAAFGQLMDERLKRPPMGFPADFPHIELLKYTSYAVGRPIDADNLKPGEIIQQSLETFSILAPLVRFLNQALSSEPN
ncbi:MAG: DUF2461 domain-containing protein [Bacteroidetes bacterium]|nr:DUF2461 domain-containing protein [Bacteroidota bacterium]